METMITIHTDGSADNQTGTGGWAATVQTATTLTELAGYAKSTTSNRMEMMAAIKALVNIPFGSEVQLYSDSSYLINTMRRKWYEAWLEEKRVSPRPNMDLWHYLITLEKSHQISWLKVKGHVGVYWNERCDELAGIARKKDLKIAHTVEVWENKECAVIREFPDTLDYQICQLHDSHYGDCHFTGKHSRKYARAS